MKEFIKIKKGLDNVIQESFKNNKETLKLVFEELSNNKDLQLLYWCVDNLENPPVLSESEINDFIDENIKLSKQINPTLLESLSNQLENVVLSELEQCINKVLFEERNALNFVDYNNSRKKLFESIANKTKTPSIDLKNFSAQDVEFINKYIQEPEQTYAEVCKECIDILNQQLTENLDVDSKLLIFQTKEKILESQIKREFLPENVIDILNLKNNLLND